ncbi:MAG: hypothetical protein ACXQTS_02215 [Candidatus Methanospirareceae archaeon]
MNTKLIEDGVKIHGRRYRDGDFLVVKDKHGNVIGEGAVKFGIYKDGESYLDGYHVGFQVEWYRKKPKAEHSLRTLVDLIYEAEEQDWTIEIRK